MSPPLLQPQMAALQKWLCGHDISLISHSYTVSMNFMFTQLAKVVQSWKFSIHTFLFQSKRKRQQWPLHCNRCGCTPTLCICVTDEICASLGFEVCQRSVLGEIVEQGSILPLRQQRASDWWPQLPQLDAVGGIKVLQGQTGGREFDTGGSLLGEQGI